MKRFVSVLVVALTLWAQPAAAAIALVACSSYASAGACAGGCAGVANQNSTGANFLIASIGDITGYGTSTIADSNSNTWVPLSSSDNSGYKNRLFYTSNNPATVGSGHTFTVGGNNYVSIAVCSFSGVDTTGPYDSGAGETGCATTGTCQTGSLTPTSDGSLFVSGVVAEETLPTIDSSFTMPTNYEAHNALSVAIGYFLPSAGAKNPTWTRVGRVIAARLAVFKASGGGPSPTSHPCAALRLLGVGCEVHP